MFNYAKKLIHIFQARFTFPCLQQRTQAQKNIFDVMLELEHFFILNLL
jgi:hypothetical protein